MTGPPGNPGVNRRAIAELLRVAKSDDKLKCTFRYHAPTSICTLIPTPFHLSLVVLRQDHFFPYTAHAYSTIFSPHSMLLFAQRAECQLLKCTTSRFTTFLRVRPRHDASQRSSRWECEGSTSTRSKRGSSLSRMRCDGTQTYPHNHAASTHTPAH